MPGKHSSPEHAEHIRGWAKTDLRNLDENVFANIFGEVHIVIGVSSSSTARPTNLFRRCVVLEVCGPHLSITDAPGIFKKTTEGVTVMPANVDIATQEIPEMAEEVGPDGQRTLSVLTKPDLVDKGGEKNVVNLIEVETSANP